MGICLFWQPAIVVYYLLLKIVIVRYLANKINSLSLSTVECGIQLLHSVSQKNLKFYDIFPKQLGNFSPNFTRLYVPICAALQISIQLSPTATKLCHIKCDHPACVSADGGHFEHDVNWVVALNMA